MTNAQIIFGEAQRLAEQGIIQYTGREFTFEDADGNQTIVKETEPIHTYNAWKELGFQVQKGAESCSKLHDLEVQKRQGKRGNGREERRQDVHEEGELLHEESGRSNSLNNTLP